MPGQFASSNLHTQTAQLAQQPRTIATRSTLVSHVYVVCWPLAICRIYRNKSKLNLNGDLSAGRERYSGTTQRACAVFCRSRFCTWKLSNSLFYICRLWCDDVSAELLHSISVWLQRMNASHSPSCMECYRLLVIIIERLKQRDFVRFVSVQCVCPSYVSTYSIVSYESCERYFCCFPCTTYVCLCLSVCAAASKNWSIDECIELKHTDLFIYSHGYWAVSWVSRFVLVFVSSHLSVFSSIGRSWRSAMWTKYSLSLLICISRSSFETQSTSFKTLSI